MNVEKSSLEKMVAGNMDAGASRAAKKPAASVPTRVQCLRCQHEITSYVFTRFTFLPYGTPSGNVMLECPKCGHLEFLSQNSPLLHSLNANPVAVGDGD